MDFSVLLHFLAKLGGCPILRYFSLQIRETVKISQFSLLTLLKIYIMLLRTELSDGFQNNIYLGNEYQLISPGCPVRFNECAKEMYGEDFETWSKEIYGFIVFECAKKTEPLFKSFRYSILSDNGAILDPLPVY